MQKLERVRIRMSAVDGHVNTAVRSRLRPAQKRTVSVLAVSLATMHSLLSLGSQKYEPFSKC